nr:MAG TPA: hypothetical protein [Caudoviricetes sp.]
MILSIISHFVIFMPFRRPHHACQLVDFLEDTNGAYLADHSHDLRTIVHVVPSQTRKVLC